jgi:hypothetical protein
MGTNLRSYARLRFFTREETIVLDSEVNNDILSITTQKSIGNSSDGFSISLSPRIIKSQNSALGTYFLSDLIKPYDLVEISFKTGEEGYKVEMIGVVARASGSLNVTEKGTPVRSLDIMGYGIIRILQSCKLFFNPYGLYTEEEKFNGIGGAPYFNSEKGKALLESKNVSEFIKALVAATFTDSFNGINNSPFFGVVFGYRGLEKRTGDTTVNNTQGLKLNNILDMQGGITTLFTENKINNPGFLTNIEAGTPKSIWELLMTYTDPPFHECFIDLRRKGTYYYPDNDGSLGPANKPKPVEYFDPVRAEASSLVGNDIGFPPLVLYVRTLPFSPDTWDNLNYHVFSTSDVISQETSTSEENIFNYYITMCSLDSTVLGNPQMVAIAAESNDNTLRRSRVPIYDTESILKYGLRAFPMQLTKFVSFIYSSPEGVHRAGNPTSIDVTKPCCTLTRQLLRWFAYGEEFETGTISLKGRVGGGPSGISLGSRLVEALPSGALTGKEFYIEGVTQHWKLGLPLRTSAIVTRGHFPNDYIDKVTGDRKEGRFSRVNKLCDTLRISQKIEGNDKLFSKIEPVDFE